MESEARFSINELLGVGIVMVVLGIGISYGLEVMGDVKEDTCDGTLEHWDSSESTCYDCPNSTYNTFIAADNECQYDNGTHLFNATSTENADTDYEGIGDGMEGVAKIPDKMPTIATVIVASVIIGILITYMWVR